MSMEFSVLLRLHLLTQATSHLILIPITMSKTNIMLKESVMVGTKLSECYSFINFCFFYFIDFLNLNIHFSYIY